MGVYGSPEFLPNNPHSNTLYETNKKLRPGQIVFIVLWGIITGVISIFLLFLALGLLLAYIEDGSPSVVLGMLACISFPLFSIIFIVLYGIKRRFNIWILGPILSAVLFLIAMCGIGMSELEQQTTIDSEDPYAVDNIEDAVNLNSFGSRQNPIIKNMPYVGIVPDESTLEITLLDVKRGHDAYTYFEQENAHVELSKGKEPILAKFRIKNIKNLSNEDHAIFISSLMFEFSNSKYAVTDATVSIDTMDVWQGKLYEGADIEGWICFAADIDDSPCYAVFDKLWFLLE